MARSTRIGARNCPAEPEHGELHAPKDKAQRWYCSHQEHDGRPKTSPRGFLAGSPCHFSPVEAETGILTPRPTRPVIVENPESSAS